MSFILDALKKAEHARPPASMPQMPAVPVAAAGLEKRRQAPAWLLAGGGAAAALLMAAVAWQFLGTSSAVQGTVAAGPPVSPASAASVAPAAPAAEQLSAAEPRRAEVRPLHSEARAGQPEPVVIAPTVQASPSLPRSGGSRGRVTPGTVVYEDLSNEPPVQRGTVQYQRNFANEPAPAAQREPAPAPSAPSPSSEGPSTTQPTGSDTPLYSNLKLTGGGLPNLHMDIHVFSEQPGNRFVFINSRKYRQGQTTREGVVIEEITPTGATMSYRGERFSMARN